MDFVKSVQDGVSEGNPTIIGILVAILVVILSIVIFGFRGSKSRGRDVLLVGLCDAGKTLMYTRLVLNRYVQSHSSMKENKGTYQVKDEKKSSSVRLVDLPGYERMRSLFLDQYKGGARGVIFVVDSLTLQKEIKDVAEFLYSLLSDSVISNSGIPLLIACNKQDQTMAKGSKVIQSQLEKEMNTLRVTKSATLEGTSSTANNNTFLGKAGKDFQFSDLKLTKVSFGECSARGSQGETGQAELNQVEDWISSIA